MRKVKVSHIIMVLLIIVVLTQPAFAQSSTRTMYFGHKGEDVLQLQKSLKQVGYYHFALDGEYNKMLEWAVINFQFDHGIRIDGITGPETKGVLSGYFAAPKINTSTYSSDDAYWLARIIEAEASGEPYEGKVAVGNVILNRVNSKDFPNTVYNVIFEYYGSIPQFSPVAEGTIYNTPSQESIKAARDAINGWKPVGNSTYFFNPSKAAGSWIVRSKHYVATIGGHAFYQ